MTQNPVKITQSITDRSNEILNKYLSEINHLPTCSDPEEEVRLAQRIQQGDQEALNRLVTLNLRFVISVAKQYQTKDIPLIDLINEGNIGLIKAAHKFDYTRGFKFISFAVWWVRQAIADAVTQQGRTVRNPSNQKNLQKKISKVMRDFEQKNGFPAPVYYIADEIGETIEKVNDALGFMTTELSMDAPIQDDQSCTLSERLESVEDPIDSRLDEESLSIDLHRAMGLLSDRQKEVIQMCYGLDGHPAMRTEEIALSLGISKERVRQIREKAKMHLSTDKVRALLDKYRRCA